MANKAKRSKPKPRNVIRFVVAVDDRMSCEWRVWTGSANTVSDEVYAAPRKLGGEIKWSFHSDGWSQHGQVESLREEMRLGDRHALDRWHSLDEVVPGWRMVLTVMFPDSELSCDASAPASTLRVPTAGAGRCVKVAIMIGDPGAEELTGPQVIAELDRRNSGRVALLAVHDEFDPAMIEEAREWLMTNTSCHLPRKLSEQRFGWSMIESPAGSGDRGVIEMLMERWAVPDEVHPVPHFQGETLPWTDRPSWMPDDNISCAHLVCEADGTARLYVDQRSRCNPEGLGSDAMKLHKQFSQGRLDVGWTRRRDGGAWTCITTQVIGNEFGVGVPPPVV